MAGFKYKPLETNLFKSSWITGLKLFLRRPYLSFLPYFFVFLPFAVSDDMNINLFFLMLSFFAAIIVPFFALEFSFANDNSKIPFSQKQPTVDYFKKISPFFIIVFGFVIFTTFLDLILSFFISNSGTDIANERHSPPLILSIIVYLVLFLFISGVSTILYCWSLAYFLYVIPTMLTDSTESVKLLLFVNIIEYISDHIIKLFLYFIPINLFFTFVFIIENKVISYFLLVLFSSIGIALTYSLAKEICGIGGIKKEKSLFSYQKQIAQNSA